MARSKEDDWAQMLEQRRMGGRPSLEGKSVEERDRMPDVACAKCKHFLETPYDLSGVGNCDLLRFGSDISQDPPKFVLEGENAYQTYGMRDAAKCTHYEEQTFIDTDATETADPRYRRIVRPMKQAFEQQQQK
ncbi:MAG: hypothetical protein SVP26_01680 [Chloroflexota bacterium]|nr:hypothetical protein [Chloroflexota bacterium]